MRFIQIRYYNTSVVYNISLCGNFERGLGLSPILFQNFDIVYDILTLSPNSSVCACIKLIKV